MRLYALMITVCYAVIQPQNVRDLYRYNGGNVAINRFNTYPGKLSAPTTERPFGGFQNRSTPTANDGSPFEKQWINDILGFFDSLLKDAQPEIVPNGTPDEVGASQYLAGLISIIEQNAALPPDATELVKGIGKIATQLTAETGTDDTAFMTSLKTKQSIDKNVPDASETEKGKVQKASDSEVATGSENTKFITSKQLKEYGSNVYTGTDPTVMPIVGDYITLFQSGGSLGDYPSMNQSSTLKLMSHPTYGYFYITQDSNISGATFIKNLNGVFNLRGGLLMQRTI